MLNEKVIKLVMLYIITVWIPTLYMYRFHKKKIVEVKIYTSLIKKKTKSS